MKKTFVILGLMYFQGLLGAGAPQASAVNQTSKQAALEIAMTQIQAQKPEDPLLNREEANKENCCNPGSCQCDRNCKEDAALLITCPCWCPVVSLFALCALAIPNDSRISNRRAF